MNKKQTQSAKKFQPKPQPIRSFKFWIGTIFYTFLFLKTVQLARFMIAFSYSVPKEQLRTNMISFNAKDMKALNPDIIHKYLDELEKFKEERKKNNN
jgi:hypothetical protein